LIPGLCESDDFELHAGDTFAGQGHTRQGCGDAWTLPDESSAAEVPPPSGQICADRLTNTQLLHAVIVRSLKTRDAIFGAMMT
jgi:hypothetical protein